MSYDVKCDELARFFLEDSRKPKPNKQPNVGGHHYPGCNDGGDARNFFTSDCDYGCGCWMGRTNSGGPDGVNPFGACPKAPAEAVVDEKLVAELAQEIQDVIESFINAQPKE